MIKMILTLFITGQTPRSVKALNSLKKLCDGKLKGQYELTIIDVLENPKAAEQEKIETRIPRFDLISAGGLPKGRTTLLTGTAGSAKTVLGAQFLAEGIEKCQEGGVFVTFEESPTDQIKNMAGFGWDIETWVKEKKWAFVDATSTPDQDVEIIGEYDFGALLARIEYAISSTKAGRVTLDFIGSVFSHFQDSSLVRRELHRLTCALKLMNITSILTIERPEEYGRFPGTVLKNL